MAQKLHRIILRHFGLVTLNFHFPKFPKVIIFMILEPSAHDHRTQERLLLSVDTPDYSTQFKKHKSVLEQYF